jgi:hypothetical protein
MKNIDDLLKHGELVEEKREIWEEKLSWIDRIKNLGHWPLDSTKDVVIIGGRSVGKNYDREVAMEMAMEAQKAQQDYNLAIAKLQHQMSKVTLEQQVEKQEKLYEYRKSNEKDVQN